LRLYLIETAQKGLVVDALTARGRAGHGSMLNDDNAVTAIAGAVARIGAHRFLRRSFRPFGIFSAKCAMRLGWSSTRPIRRRPLSGLGRWPGLLGLRCGIPPIRP